MDDGLQLTLLGKPKLSRNDALVMGLVCKKPLALLYYERCQFCSLLTPQKVMPIFAIPHLLHDL